MEVIFCLHDYEAGDTRWGRNVWLWWNVFLLCWQYCAIIASLSLLSL